MSINPCACLGKRYNEPYCHCEMVSRGLERSKEYKAQHTPEAIAARNAELDKVFSDMFKWRKDGRN